MRSESACLVLGHVQCSSRAKPNVSNVKTLVAEGMKLCGGGGGGGGGGRAAPPPPVNAGNISRGRCKYRRSTSMYSVVRARINQNDLRKHKNERANRFERASVIPK
jgi:hypothetical protein